MQKWKKDSGLVNFRSAFLVGVLANVRRVFEKLAAAKWLSCWSFWWQEKRLERLIVEADANPKDAAKQSALLAELNSAESVNKAFVQRDHAVDSKGVAEYLRALLVTKSLSEYLPDEQSGKPATLPTLATIMPRGSALGMVEQVPSNDETSVSKKQLLARLDVCTGGRVAEELIFGQEHITTGASSDLHIATELAQYMSGVKSKPWLGH